MRVMRELEKEPLHRGPQLSGVSATAEGRRETRGIQKLHEGHRSTFHCGPIMCRILYALFRVVYII